jgi:hypothetical protein
MWNILTHVQNITASAQNSGINEHIKLLDRRTATAEMQLLISAAGSRLWDHKTVS